MGNSNRGSETTFVRRKFTLPKTLDEMVEKLAEEHYQGNVSLFIRAAIEDHRKTLTGTKEELVLQQATRQLDDLENQQAEILQTLSNLDAESNTETSTQGRTRLGMPDSMTDDMTRVYTALVEATDPLRLADLSEELGIPAVHLEPVLGRMVDHGYITVHGTNPQRLKLEGTQTGDQL
jgi:Arc/MetJ-type ribon-helix-helix transcriptional regulator